MEDNEIATDNDYPGVVIDTITFNDGTTLPLTPNSIIVFTGANNCGKSQILRDIEGSFADSTKKISIVVSNLTYHLRGAISQSFLLKNFHVNHQGNLEHNISRSIISKESLLYEWNGDADVFSSQNPMLRTLMIFYIVQGSFLPMIA